MIPDNIILLMGKKISGDASAEELQVIGTFMKENADNRELDELISSLQIVKDIKMKLDWNVIKGG